MVTRSAHATTWNARTLSELWDEQLAAPPDATSAADAARRPRGWLLDHGLASILEPFAVLAQHHRDLTRIVGLDGGAARALLSRLPADGLAERQNYAPTLGDLLTVIAAHPGEVSGIGYVVGPDRADERLSLDGLLIKDPSLYDFAPDIQLGQIPAMVRDLDEEDWEDYHEHRQACLTHSTARQQWFAARHRYGIAGAETPPTEIEVRLAGGRHVLRLWWT